MVDFRGGGYHPGLFHCWYVEDAPHRWQEAQARRRDTGDARMVIPLTEFSLEDLLAFLQGPLPEGKTLYVTVRSSFEMEGSWWVVAGVAVFPEVLPGSFPGQPSSDLLTRFLTLHEATDEPTEPCLRDRWRKISSWREERRRFQEAQARARRLLEEHLSPEQRQELAEKREFRVRAMDGRTYLIRQGTHGNVWRLNRKGEKIVNYCIIIEDQAPAFDHMLAQKLLLEANIKAFLKTANARRVPRNDEAPARRRAGA